MADKAISELVAAPSVTPDSLFVLQQDGTAKKLTAKVLENWLLSFADGHGGIQSYELLKTVGLVKTYRFTLADQTPIDIDVVDGRGIESVKPTSTDGLVVTYTITYNDGKTDTITVTNGAKGDKGDRADIWVKYASQKPTASSHSFGDVPDAWIGIATGHNMDAAPTDWQQYTWFQWKGEKGDTGEPATLVSSQVTYQVGDSGTIIPSGSWTTSVPHVTPGKFLWTREVTQFNTGSPIVKYSVSRFGMDGLGSVTTVAGVSPDPNGNVNLDADDVKALPIGGGTMGGAINMNGHSIKGLNAPTENDQAANMGFVNQQVKKAAPPNMLINPLFRNPVNQRGQTVYSFDSGYTMDGWRLHWSGNDCRVAIYDGYISLYRPTNSAYLFQNLPLELGLVGKTVTVAAKVRGSGAVGFCFRDGQVREKNEISDSDWTILTKTIQVPVYNYENVILNGVEIATIPGKNFDIEWAGLFPGEHSAETIQEYMWADKAIELLKCMRYFQKTNRLYQAVASSNGVIPGTKFIVPMRIAPTVTVYDADGLKDHVTIWTSDGVSSVPINQVPANETGIYYIDADVPAGTICCYSYEASAEL